MLVCWLGWLPLADSWSQSAVSGQITDATTQEAIPFANVVVHHTERGTTTDLDGFYRLNVPGKADSLHISFVGYVARTVAIDNRQQINVALTPDVVSLNELVFTARENPAFALLKRVQRQSSRTDKRSLRAYEYESYIRTEVALREVSGKIHNKTIRKAYQVAKRQRARSDTTDRADIPIIMTETLSRAYYQNHPEVKREDVLKSKISGIGLSSSSWLSQLTASSLQQFNFYENWMKIMGKAFVSPLAPSGKLLYNYYLSDSLMRDGDYCYRLDFVPKNPQDLAFEGTAWITKETAALKAIDARINPEANLNYIRNVRVVQDLAPVADGAWLPTTTQTTIDSEKFSDYPGLRVRSLVSNRDEQVNQVKPLGFYATNVTIDEGAYRADSAFWRMHRHNPLGEDDQRAFAIIDTLNQLPAIKRTAKLVDTFASSHYDLGLIELGPIPYTYARNEVEGHRFRLGFKTSPRFSSRWTFRNHLAYGTLDRQFKFGVEANYIWRRAPWTQLTVYHAQDLSQLGWFPESEKEVKFFEAAALWGDLSTGYRYRRSSIRLFRQLPKGLAPEVEIQRQYTEPLFDFSYPLPLENQGRDTSDFVTTELRIALQFARDEQFVQRDNRRISMGGRRWPVLRAEYGLGLNNVLGSDFSYQKVKFSARQQLSLGLLGTSQYVLEGGYIFSHLPYPLLEVHLGNTSPFYYRHGFNTMNRAEFVSDHYASLRYAHSFEGFFLNRIPLLRRLDWRLITSANVLYGGVRAENRAPQAVGQELAPTFRHLSDNIPFAEIGYGVENIFRLIRVEAYHRLTYLDHPSVRRFAIKVGLQVKF
ncbi:MAG: DUF5686 family protein [Tunicatimonas sp.]